MLFIAAQAPDTDLYLIRHAESLANKDAPIGVVGGRNADTGLSPLGVHQSSKLGTHLLAQNIVPSVAYRSFAQRTEDTARHVFAVMGLDLEIVRASALVEQSQGDWEGKLKTKVYTAEVFTELARLGIHFKAPNGESVYDVGHRLLKWADTLAGGCVFAFTHDWVIRSFAAIINGWTQEQAFEAKVPNASYTLFVRRNGIWQMRCYAQPSM